MSEKTEFLDEMVWVLDEMTSRGYTDTRDIFKDLDALSKEVEGLREEVDMWTQHTVDNARRAEKAEADLTTMLTIANGWEAANKTLKADRKRLREVVNAVKKEYEALNPNWPAVFGAYEEYEEQALIDTEGKEG
jgi:hypothetical protein